MMKKLVALLLLTLALVSCSSEAETQVKDQPKEEKQAAATSEVQETQPPETTASEPEEPNYYISPVYKEAEPTLTTEENGIVTVGSERQLFLDDFLIDTSKSSFSINTEAPVKQEAVFRFDKSYERGDCVYHNIVRMPDGSYRMYYKAYAGVRRICYIESYDGINWTRPQLTTNKQQGLPSNIVTTEDSRPDNLFVFYDTNPACLEGRRLKGVYGQWGEFLSFEYSVSGEGNSFPFSSGYAQVVLGRAKDTGGCYYDTLNTMYWDEYRQQYVAFVRGFHNDKGNYNLGSYFVTSYPHKILRDIRIATSDDGNSFTIPEPLKYNTEDDYQLYANAITPYYRSPGVYVGLPTRYYVENDEKRTQVYFMSSRDLLNWTRTEEPYLLPEGKDHYSYNDGEGYPCVGFIETSPEEMSFYMKEKASVPTLYRYTLRVDGFTSASGSLIVTKPLKYKGETLEINFEGEIKVTMTGSNGSSVTSEWLSGNEVSKTVSFDGSLPEGEAVLTFEMKDGTKLYSFKYNSKGE